MATINKKFQYVKVYTVLKKTGRHTNAISEALAKFFENRMLKRKGG